MPLTDAQKQAIDEVFDEITVAKSSQRGKRLLCDMFMDLVDREAWPEYYEVIPEPRCLSLIKDRLSKSGYKNALDVYSDLSLVFLNALYYNEEGSQISKDAAALKSVLEAEWKKHQVLPTPRASPPPFSPQKASSSARATRASSPAKAQTPAATKPLPTARPAKAPPAAATIPQAAPATPISTPAAPVKPLPLPTPVQQSAGNSSDMEVDIGGGPSDNEGDNEGEGMAEDMARDAESDEIVRQLERGLPRWEGYGEKGWTENVSMDRCLEIVTAIKSHKDLISNNRVAAVLDSIPEDATIKDLSFNYPLSLKIIEGKARNKLYNSSKDFDLEFVRLFEKGRRWYEIGSEPYGNVLLLQRLYQSLTSPTPPSGPPFTSQTNFASIRAGPGTARPLHSSSDADGAVGVTTFRVSNKDRQFVDEVYYKGWSIRLADWLHLANPDDPSRPIIAQVFKCYISEEPSKKGRPGVTVCWYYRPEQTWHAANRQFWEGEVFKTGHFADHPLEDIIEKIACQFTARHIRGRPRPPFWYPGWPLYVCDCRYNDRERVFVRIKNWNSCVPEEVRKSQEFMPIYPFERTVFPRRFPSPFITKPKGSVWRNVKFPGGIGESVEKGEGERVEGGGTGRKRPRKSAPGTPMTRGNVNDVGQSRGLYVGTAAVAPAAAAVQPGYQNPIYGPGQQHVQQIEPQRRVEDRSIITAAGGPGILASASVEKLPPETAKYFDRDPGTNEVLWFSGPPIDFARRPAPRHSLNYLHFLAMKQKNASKSENNATEENGVDDSLESKRRRINSVPAPPTVTETIDRLWRSMDMDKILENTNVAT